MRPSTWYGEKSEVTLGPILDIECSLPRGEANYTIKLGLTLSWTILNKPRSVSSLRFTGQLKVIDNERRLERKLLN